MKVLLAAAILAALITPTMAEDYLGNMVKWERESRNLVPKTKKRVPKAESLVRRANALLKGDPICAAMLEASKLLDKAQYIYIDAKEFGGDVRNTGRRVSWLEDISKAGKCRRDKASDDNIVKWERESRTLIPWTNKPLPKAEALVRKANALLKGEPTCTAMLEASEILKEAKSIYDEADEATGPVQDTGYRSGWLEYLAKAGKCRKES